MLTALATTRHFVVHKVYKIILELSDWPKM
jgi:hypothetical protein